MLNKGAYSGSCAVGLSGLVFGLIAVDNAVGNLQQRSIFGFLTVPAKVHVLTGSYLLNFASATVEPVSYGAAGKSSSCAACM